ncbi:MAG: class I SAM-dependent RNA methyltransferase [Firmicutes bacterium]|nr:class I SAM-dependent RNA methyltransferase [Bacillota bacterium]
MKLELIATSTFGLEAPVKRELEALGFKILKSEDGKITFQGDERGVVKANLWLRCADRVQIKMAEFKALEFEDLFQQVKAIPWEEWIPPDGKFIVNGSSVKSKLSSVPACQSVSEKAIVERLKEIYGIEYFEKTGALYDIKITLLKDRVTVTLDTTGPGLHKRGYRQNAVIAPIKETLAAAMINLSFWRNGRILVDPCCGSGTIPIEAAMIARNIAPGLNRNFVSEEWEAIPAKLWKEERKKAYEVIDWDSELEIYAYDIDKRALESAKENAAEAGVEEDIVFQLGDGGKMQSGGNEGGIIVTNPPYGERIGDRESIDKLYEGFNKFLKENKTWSMFAITPDKTIEEKVFGRPADRRRKLFNGRMEVCYYQYHGQKPEKK